MPKRWLCLMLLALLLWPITCPAGSLQDFSPSLSLENGILLRMSDTELAQASGQGALLSLAVQEPQARRIILWDEWSKTAGTGVKMNLPQQGQVIISGGSNISGAGQDNKDTHPYCCPVKKAYFHIRETS